jgi:hypothetical protein
MAINFQQVINKIKQIGLGERARQETLDAQRKQARILLETWANKTAELRGKVERAGESDSKLRCALPLEEPLDTSSAEPALPGPVTILAADGSQILPDRHSALFYSLVNVGAIVMQPASGKSPEIFTESRLLFAEELYTESGTLSGEAIEQRRDIAERRMLLDLAESYPSPLIALTDGPVELWGAKNGGEDDYRRNLEIHKSILSQLQSKDVTVAGYVDKPGADLVVRSLEIGKFSSDEDYKNMHKQHPLRGVTDRWLFSWLPAGSRSAVFGLQSSSRAHYTGDLALHFIYMNVGDTRHASLVRVEFPRWVVEDTKKLDLLHAVLLQQCRVMGARPYPYILHRAHEIAVVTFEEKQQIEQMLELELRRAGSEVEGMSNKKSAKDLPGKGKR